MENLNKKDNPNIENRGVSLEVKTAIMEQIGDMEPDAIVVLSGGIRRLKGNANGASEYTPSSWGNGFDDGYTGLVTGAKTRTIAAGSAVAKLFNNIPIVTTSASSNVNDPSMAEVYANDMEKRGIDSNRITKEESSYSTISQYVELMKLAKKNDWKNLAVIINDYCQPRARILFDKFDQIITNNIQAKEIYRDFLSDGRQINFISSEPIMEAMSPHYKEYFKKVEESEQYKKIVASEANGVEDIKNGNYYVRLK
ncbi:MAG: YdcF family protein [Candidatus Nomurabacteria bacterium]|jgi:uncharacterized SAM-binding protein YcdF (DUF218 family)|nr:YdcF family protein [Candidatus Nomurabacteria bacterium]